MSTRQNDPGGPEDIDAAFAEIVAGIERDDPQFGQRPAADAATSSSQSEDSTPPETTTSEPATPAADPAEGTAPSGPRDWAPVDDPEDEHFVPPEPPPLRAPSGGSVLGIGIIAVGVVVLLVPGLAGLAAPVTLPLGLLLISTGIGWLLFRLRRGPSDHDDDDGARI